MVQVLAVRPRKALPPLLVAVLASCGVARAPDDTVGQGRGWSGTFSVDGTPVEPEPGIQVVFEQDGTTKTFRPVARNGAVTTWRSLDGDVIALREGIVVSTQAFTPDLMAVDAVFPSQWSGAPAPANIPRVHRYSHGNDRDVLRAYMCELSSHQPVTSSGNRDTNSTVRTDEACFNATQAFTNSYWLDRSGLMVQSRQWLGDDTGYIRLTPHAPVTQKAEKEQKP